VTFESDLHCDKHFLPITTTEAGISIERNDVQPKKASGSIRLRIDRDSNVTDEREVHFEKHLLHKIATEAGIFTDSSNEQFAKVSSPIWFSFDPNSNLTLLID
jgi:hypothetical protein